MKLAFEVKNPNITINLTSGGSQELASRILKGDTCDVFSPSDPLAGKNLMDNMVNGKAAASFLRLCQLPLCVNSSGLPPDILLIYHIFTF